MPITQNVRLDYDVDIAVECTDFYYYSTDGVGSDVRKAAAIQETFHRTRVAIPQRILSAT